MGIGQALLYSVLGILVVFFALVLLMIIIKLMVKIIPAEEKKEEIPAAETVCEEIAKGSAGDMKLNGVEPRIAAMCMAIVADQLQKPINELRFISIREVE